MLTALTPPQSRLFCSGNTHQSPDPLRRLNSKISQHQTPQCWNQSSWHVINHTGKTLDEEKDQTHIEETHTDLKSWLCYKHLGKITQITSCKIKILWSSAMINTLATLTRRNQHPPYDPLAALQSNLHKASCAFLNSKPVPAPTHTTYPCQPAWSTLRQSISRTLYSFCISKTYPGANLHGAS